MKGVTSTEAAFVFTNNFLERNVTTYYSSTNLPQQNATTTNIAGCVELSAASVNPCDNADSLVSEASRLVVDDVVYIALLPSLTLVGVVTNLVNMAVFWTQGLGDRVHLCLFSLSLADLLALTTLSIRYLRNFLVYVMGSSWAYNVWTASLIRYRLLSIHTGFQLVTNFISIVIAVDRWVCVTWPLRVARMLSTRKACAVIVCFSVCIFAGNQFSSFKYDVVCAYLRGAQTKTFLYVVPSKLYLFNPTLMETLDSFVFSSLVPTSSLLITATATILTVLKLRRATLWRDSSARGGGADVINQKEKAVTYMLVVISCVFITCVSPRVVRAWCRFFIPEFRAWGKRCGLLLLTDTLMNVMLAVNSSVNFFVYFNMGSRFRSTLRHLMTRCCKCRVL